MLPMFSSTFYKPAGQTLLVALVFQAFAPENHPSPEIPELVSHVDFRRKSMRTVIKLLLPDGERCRYIKADRAGNSMRAHLVLSLILIGSTWAPVKVGRTLLEFSFAVCD